MSQPHSRFLVTFAVLGCLGSASSACTMDVDQTGRDDRAVTAGGASCDTPAAPIPDGWEVRALPTFSVAAPREGMLVSQPTESMVQFYSREPGTSLAAFERRDLVSLGEATGAWKRALGDGCTLTTEPTRHLCDEAVSLHASCSGDRTIDVLLVQRHGTVFAMSCELQGGDATVCPRFLATLRIQ